MSLKNQWNGWWSKVNIFDGDSYKKFIDEKNKINKLIIMYIDLDMIICGSIDDLILNH